MALLHFDKNLVQRDFVRSKARKTAYAGAIRAGKTWGGIARMLYLMNRMPGSRFLVARRQFTDLFSTTLKVLFEMISALNGGSYDKPGPFVARYDGQFHDFYLRDGGEIYCRHGGDISTYKGLELSGYLLDQIEEFEQEVFEHISSRLSYWNFARREEFKGKHDFYPEPFEILLANPDPGWVKDLLFGNPEQTQDERYKEWSVFQTTTEHNRANLGPGYIENLYKTHPKEWCDRFLEGSWDIRGGQIYKEFSEAVHVVDDFVPPAHWLRYVAMDWGINEFHRCVTGWAAVNEQGEIYIYKELSVTGLLASQVAIEQHKISKATGVPYDDNGGFQAWFDPSTDNRGGIVERTIMDEFALHKVYARKANNDVQAGINKVQEVLHVNPETGRPRLFICRSCTWIRRGFKLYQWKPVQLHNPDGARTDKPLKKDDDEMDMVRYLIMAILEDKAAPLPKQRKREDLYNEMMLERMRQNDYFSGEHASESTGISTQY